jgi:N-ethylmaleimide reductase
MHDSNAKATFSYVLESLNRFNLAYVHLMEPNEKDLANGSVLNPVLSTLKPFYKNTIFTNGGYDHSKGDRVLATGYADLVSFGQLFIANPDLPQRFGSDAKLNSPNPATFYGKGTEALERGYTDYPFLQS